MLGDRATLKSKPTPTASRRSGIRYTPLMLMVIFGAGASYDSSPDFPAPSGIEVIRSEPWRPPLTSELFLDANNKFGDIVQKYPRLQGILPFLRSPHKGRSVEQQLELYKASIRRPSNNTSTTQCSNSSNHMAPLTGPG